MRRRYRIVCLFLTALVLLAGMCYGSFRYAEKVTEEKVRRQEHEPYPVEQTSGGSDQKINSDTRYIVEIYNEDTEETVREERTMPSEYAGMTRSQMEAHLRAYMEDGEPEKGLTDMQLVSFSRDELVIRKVYQEEPGYILRLVDGEVAIFHKGDEDTYEKTGISQNFLTEEEIRALEEGYSVETEKDLYSILENFSS